MILFTSPDCAGCARIKEQIKFDDIIDISTDHGFEHAQKLRVRSVPTVIAYGTRFIGEHAIMAQFGNK